MGPTLKTATTEVRLDGTEKKVSRQETISQAGTRDVEVDPAGPRSAAERTPVIRGNRAFERAGAGSSGNTYQIATRSPQDRPCMRATAAPGLPHSRKPLDKEPPDRLITMPICITDNMTSTTKIQTLVVGRQSNSIQELTSISIGWLWKLVKFVMCVWGVVWVGMATIADNNCVHSNQEHGISRTSNNSNGSSSGSSMRIEAASGGKKRGRLRQAPVPVRVPTTAPTPPPESNNVVNGAAKSETTVETVSMGRWDYTSSTTSSRPNAAVRSRASLASKNVADDAKSSSINNSDNDRRSHSSSSRAEIDPSHRDPNDIDNGSHGSNGSSKSVGISDTGIHGTTRPRKAGWVLQENGSWAWEVSTHGTDQDAWTGTLKCESGVTQPWQDWTFHDAHCGIGGYTEGLRLAGGRCTGAFDRCGRARDVYRRRTGPEPQGAWGSFGVGEWPSAQVLVAALPCEAHFDT